LRSLWYAWWQETNRPSLEFCYDLLPLYVLHRIALSLDVWEGPLQNCGSVPGYPSPHLRLNVCKPPDEFGFICRSGPHNIAPHQHLAARERSSSNPNCWHGQSLGDKFTQTMGDRLEHDRENTSLCALATLVLGPLWAACTSYIDYKASLVWPKYHSVLLYTCNVLDYLSVL